MECFIRNISFVAENEKVKYIKKRFGLRPSSVYSKWIIIRFKSLYMVYKEFSVCYKT